MRQFLGLGFALVLVVGCGASRFSEDFGRRDGTGRSAAGKGLRVRWSKTLSQEWGGLYVPLERAKAALDPSNNRLFIGSSERILWALEANGRPLYQFRAESGIEAEPTVDPRTNELYVPTAAGIVHALEADTGKVRWKAELSGAISKAAVLSRDVLYVVTDDDGVFAVARKDGAILWRFKRDPRAGLKIGGHAGLLLADQRLITGFSDGSVVALSPGDGRALWVVDTTLDFADPGQAEQGFVDIDTTPVQIDDTVYVASFLGGLYGLGASDGVPHVRRSDWTAITSIAAEEHSLIIASADHGVMCVEAGSLAPRWVRKTKPFVASNVEVEHDTVYMTESRGAFLALSLADGRELGRIQTEHGFLASPSLRDGRGFILGNTGILYAFDY
ncbi:MAG TPA: PQQ-binding-like beta-propeller repeat protein [Polyangiales bacterium]|nr:PQQ-binding-like beta-propeller repeat protein [Polyangiales bacterium]